MTRVAFLWCLLGATAAAGAVQSPPSQRTVIGTFRRNPPPPVAPAPAPAARADSQPAYVRPAPIATYAPSPSAIDAAISDWRRLRASEGYPFASYAAFLAANPGFPGESAMRRTAEKAMRPGESAERVLYFYRDEKPVSGNGWARLADAYDATGRASEALDAARSAWASADLSAADETSLFARHGSQFTRVDHDRRVDALLFGKQASNAQRYLAMTSAARQPAFAARIAMLQRAPDVEALYAAAFSRVTSDAGLMMDRARYLRDAGWETPARQLAARPHAFADKPADVSRFYDMLVVLARGAAAERQWSLAYDIARQVDDALAPGTAVSAQSYAVRDDYTTLAWLGGTAALNLRRPADAVAMFDKYAHGGKSLQVASKGYYWAGRAAAQAGQPVQALAYFEKAAATPELFYGQLALERLGRKVSAPAPLPAAAVTEAQRRAFYNRPLVAAVRLLGQQGYRSDQSLFIRALSEAAETQADRFLAAELASAIGRQDLAVWTARSARNSGTAFYYRPAYPIHPSASATGKLWSVIHGITRQESSFDRAVISHANAHGMMQVVPATGREQADKMGVAFDSGRLTSDPAFNVMIGTAYFQRLLNNWGGSYPLAIAAYNAGSGNVRKWVNAYGDPRTGGVDMLNWIEQIPFEETRGYVQRVLENSVVYDTINPTAAPPGTIHLSAYLGKSARPG